MITGVIGGYVYVVIEELKAKLELQNLTSSSLVLKESKLEKDSFVLSHDFNFFITFLNKDPDNKISPLTKSGKVLLQEDMTLPEPYPNSCDRYLCLQSRVGFERIPSNLWKGLMGVEDYRFLNHQGIDPISIARAIIVDIKAMSFVQGGSTLTQQLAKNLFLTNEKKFQRKVQEMIYAIYLERNFSKDEIITKYFNEVFWGVVGGVSIKGVHMASLAYFQKEPENLSPFESAILIGMLKGPGYYNPTRYLDRLKGRVSAVFDRLVSLKLYRADEKRWTDKEWLEWSEGLKEYKENKLFLSLFRTLTNDQASLEPYEKFTFNRAVVYTFKDLADRIEGLDIAVKAIAINNKCESFDCENVFTYYTKFERDKRVAITKEFHQVGSILKPLIYYEFVNQGKSLSDMVSTDPITLKLKSGNWTPKDHDYGGLKEVSLEYAIQKSRNIPLIRTAKEVGFGILEEKLIQKFPRLLTPLSEYPAQLLGAIELSLSEVSNAYLNFFKTQCEQIRNHQVEFEKTLIYIMAQAQQTTIRNSANAILKHSLIFGKTGTTNNGLDNWYIASDGERFYGIWFGVDSAREARELKLYGSNSAFRIFQYFISYRAKQLRDFYCL